MDLREATKIVELFADKYSRGDIARAVNEMDMARDCLTMRERSAFYIVRDEREKHENASI